MFLALPDQDPLGRGTDPDLAPNPDLDPSTIKEKQQEKRKKRDPYFYPDPLVRGTDTRIRICNKMSWIRNTDRKTICEIVLFMILK